MSGWGKGIKWLVIVVVVLVVLSVGGYILFVSLVFDALEPSNQGLSSTGIGRVTMRSDGSAALAPLTPLHLPNAAKRSTGS